MSKLAFIDSMNNKMKAWKLGKNPWMHIDNPNTQETAKRIKRIRANDLLGIPGNKYVATKPPTTQGDIKKDAKTT